MKKTTDQKKTLNGRVVRVFIFSLLTLVVVSYHCSDSRSPEDKSKVADNLDSGSYPVPEGAENWPSFRGVNGSGVTGNQDLPLNWDINKGTSVHWVYETEGLGLSSPVVWRNRVFITTAVGVGADESLKAGLYGDIESVQNEKPHVWKVICLDRLTGKVRWSREACRGIPKVKRHPKSSHATASVATDGSHVVAMFGSEGMYCYDFEGKLLWKKDFGLLDSAFFMVPSAQWGWGASPVIHKGVVILQSDVLKNSFISAIDISNGQTLWKTDRAEVPTWSTPAIHEGKDQTQIIVNGFKHIGSYDFKTGKPIWWLKGGGDIPAPTPVIGFNHVFITNAHGRLRPIYAIRLDAKGDISLKGKEKSSQYITWFEPRKGAYLPSPLLYGDHLYVCPNNGVLSCWEARTGKRLYKARIGGKFNAYSASPVAADGKIYFTSEEGNVYIIRAGPVYKHLATNRFEETCLATPAISGKMLFVRTIRKLYAIGKGGRSQGVEIIKKKAPTEWERVQLDKVKKDGSIKNVAEIIRIVRARLKGIDRVTYDLTLTGQGELKYGVLNAKTSLMQYGNYLPKYIKIEANYVGLKPEAGRNITGGSDGNEFYVIDHLKKKMRSDIEMAAFGIYRGYLYQAIIGEYVSKDVLSMEESAKKKTLKGIKNIGDIKCYEVSFMFPQYNNYEITWYFSIQDFIPRAKRVFYKMRTGKFGGLLATIKNLVINPDLKPEDFKYQIPDGYKREIVE